MFKHTFDVIEDYVCYVLVTVGAIALSVRLLTTLSSGDLVCIIIGVTNATEGHAGLGPYPPGGTLGMIGYAQTDEGCIRYCSNSIQRRLFTNLRLSLAEKCSVHSWNTCLT